MKTSVELSQSVFDRLFALMEQGFYLQAYDFCQSVDLISTRQDTATQILAGRLVGYLGAPRQRAAILLRAWRQNPTNPDALYYYISTRLWRQGPLAAYRLIQKYQPQFEHFTPDQQAHWLGLKAQVVLEFRDFDRTDAYLQEAEILAPDDPWITLLRSRLLEQEDQYPEALALAQQALAQRPWYRPAVLTAAHLHTLLSQDDQALHLLQQATTQLESGEIWTQLASLQLELGQYAQAQHSYQQYEQACPLLEKAGQARLWSAQADIAYQMADFNHAHHLAQKLAEYPYYQSLAQRLLDLPEGKRVILPVGFVRQHHMTCAPATLTTLCAYWGISVDHHQIVDSICYNGTSSYSERDWASQQGWAVCEFTVTWDSIIQLIDAGVPFTLSTVEATSAHLQAVIGYDSRLQTLIIRDPYHRGIVEPWAEEFLERYRASGPRGMVILPAEKAGLLETLELPDSRLYDQLHDLQAALLKHDRSTASDWSQRMNGVAPHHRLALQAQFELAYYDSDQASGLTVIEQMLEQFPAAPQLMLQKLQYLQELASRQDCLDWLAHVIEQDQFHPIFWTRLAKLFSDDAKASESAISLLLRSIGAMPTEAYNYFLLANLYWSQRQFDLALDLYRFAACLEDKEQTYGHSYFLAARGCRQTSVALQLLQQRWHRDQKQSTRPVYALAIAYDHLDRPSEAIEVLEQTQAWHPDDGDLLLYRAKYLGEHGQFAQAHTLLDEAKAKTAHSHWLSTAAKLAQFEYKPNRALDLWQQLVTADPLDIEANRAVSQLLAEQEGVTAAREFLAATCSTFPDHAGLHHLWYEQVQEGDPIVAEQVLRRLVEINPKDAWSWRQIAWQLGRQQQLEAAFETCETAQHLDPHSTAYFTIYGCLCILAKDMPTAKTAFKEAIQRSVDSSRAISELMDICQSTEEQKDVLDFIFQEFQQQVITGDSLFTFYQYARTVLTPADFDQRIQEVHAARPDLWQAWTVRSRQLLSSDRTTEALAIAGEAAERFPLLPRVWVDLAIVHRTRKDDEAEEQALQTALRINPGWDSAIQQLADLYDRTDALDKCKALLETALMHSPLEAYLHGYLADALWKLDDQETALQHLQKALRLDSNYDWGWNKLREWAQALERLHLTADLARELTVTRSGEAQSWLRLAEHLAEEDTLDERLAAVDQAIELNPCYWDAYDLKARVLAAAERFEDAIATCTPTQLDDDLPVSLAARTAWIKYQQGKFDEAIQDMQAVVAKDPGYYAGWYTLADWYRQQNNLEGYLTAAQQLVRLAPKDAISWGYQGDAKHKTGDRLSAKADFRKAFELDPEYSFAGLSLFDLELEGLETEAAAKTLAQLREQDNDEFVLARTVQLAARQNDLSTATQTLEQLCLYPCDSEWPLNTAVETMISANWTTQAQTILFDAFPQPKVYPQVGHHWVYCCVKLKQQKFCQKQLRKFHPENPVQRQALITYIRILSYRNSSAPLMKFLRANRDVLRSHTETWGIVGYALSERKEHKINLKWLSDWKQRSEVKPWMLLNLVQSFQATKDPANAIPVSQYALTLPDDDGTPVHRLWLAYAASYEGQTAKASQYLQDINPQYLEKEYLFLQYLVKANLAIDCQELPRHQRMEQAKLHVQQAMAVHPEFRSRFYWQHVFSNSVWRIAKRRQSISGYIWALSQSIPPDIFWAIIYLLGTFFFLILKIMNP